MRENVLGVDVAKNWIDVVGPDGHARIADADLARFAGAGRGRKEEGSPRFCRLRQSRSGSPAMAEAAMIA